MNGHQLFDLGEFRLQDGTLLPGASLAYQTFGTLSLQKDNVVLLPSAFNSAVEVTAQWVGAGQALDPSRWFIVVTGLFGNGQSSSPSNMPAPFDGPRFPAVTIADNVAAQAQLLDALGVGRLHLVAGFSMGALQAFHWGAHYPDRVDRILALCGAARCSPHNYAFLAGLRAALTADQNFAGGDYVEPPRAGLIAFGRVDASWIFSSHYFQALDLEALGCASIEEYLVREWDARYVAEDANNLLCMVRTWQLANIAANPRFDCNFDDALAAIRAKAVIMPSETDLFFPVADSAAEVAGMPAARLVPIPSRFGHVAGGRSNDADTAFIERHLRELLAD